MESPYAVAETCCSLGFVVKEHLTGTRRFKQVVTVLFRSHRVFR